MSDVRIYMKKNQNAWDAQHPTIFDNSGKGWFYWEDNVAINRNLSEKQQRGFTYLCKQCIHHTEQSIITDPEWELVGEL